jgi:hypothetical protein
MKYVLILNPARFYDVEIPPQTKLRLWCAYVEIPPQTKLRLWCAYVEAYAATAQHQLRERP